MNAENLRITFAGDPALRPFGNNQRLNCDGSDASRPSIARSASALHRQPDLELRFQLDLDSAGQPMKTRHRA